MRTVFRVVYVLILLSVIVLLIANGVISKHKDIEWLMWLILGAGFIIMSFILSYLSNRSSALMAKENHYNPADKKVVRTVEGSIFEIVTILFLIGAWSAAAINHQLSGKGILDIPVADLIVCSILAIGALVLAYFPKWMGNAGNFKNDRQVLLDIRRHRICAVAFALLALVIPFIPNANDKVLGIIYLVVIFALSFALSSRKILQAGEPKQTTI